MRSWQNGNTPLMRKIIKGFLWFCGITVLLLGAAYYYCFWRHPLPTFVTLPPGSRVIISRPSLVMLEGTGYYLRAKCPGKPKAVLSAFAAGIVKNLPPEDPESPNSAAISKMKSDRVYTCGQDSLKLYPPYPRVYPGPPHPTSEGYYFSCGGSESVLVDAWPDGENTQIELTIEYSLP